MAQSNTRSTGKAQGMRQEFSLKRVVWIRLQHPQDLAGFAMFHAASAKTRLVQVFMLSADEELNEAGLKRILASGHSRIPVHAPGERYA